jgi:trans-aconitate 2-methyltransferase
MADAWDPAQYERFQQEREQPGIDLIAGVSVRPGMKAIDLGCGTGALTARLHALLPGAQTLGLDNSPAMLAKAPSAPGLQFREGDIATFDEPAAYDLVFSNAALQWLPEDHPGLFARLRRALRPGGQLAIQVPANQDHPSQTIARDLSGEASPIAVLPPERYAELLHELGFTRQAVQLRVYGHLLPRPSEVVEWCKGTLLTHYQHRPDYPDFLRRYSERLLAVLPAREPYFFTFKRILLWAQL